jgi:hypothetical protein
MCCLTPLLLLLGGFQQIHDWICNLLWQGQAPEWLANLHETLGLTSF